MQKWCPEPFAAETPTPAATAGVVFRGVDGPTPAAGGEGAAEPLQFQRETGYTDRHALLGTLTREERAELFELAELDVAEAYEARQKQQADEFATRLDDSKREAAAALEAWTRDLESAVREDLATAAAGAARLAIQIAEKIVRGTVDIDRGVLTRALETILFKQQAATPLQVFASPRDAVWLADQSALRERLNIEVVSDDRRLADGDCRVRSDGREWDLTIDGQLQTLAEIIEEAITTRKDPACEPGPRSGDASGLG